MSEKGADNHDAKVETVAVSKPAEVKPIGDVEDAMSKSKALVDTSDPDASLQAIVDKISQRVGESEGSRRTKEIMGEHPEVFGGADAAEIAKQNDGKDRQIIIKGVRSVKSEDDSSTEQKVSDQLAAYREKKAAEAAKAEGVKSSETNEPLKQKA